MALSLSMFPFPSSPDDGEATDFSLCLAYPPHLLVSICPAILLWDLLKLFPWEWPWAFFLLLLQQGWLNNMFLLVRPPHLLPHPPIFSSVGEAAASPGEECSLWQIPIPIRVSLLWQAGWESPVFMALLPLYWGCQLVEEAVIGFPPPPSCWQLT